MSERNFRKTMGTVVSDKMDKTIVVAVSTELSILSIRRSLRGPTS